MYGGGHLNLIHVLRHSLWAILGLPIRMMSLLLHHHLLRHPHYHLIIISVPKRELLGTIL
jgi:hypothetical protein